MGGGRHRKYRFLQSYLNVAGRDQGDSELLMLDSVLRTNSGGETRFVMYWGANGRGKLVTADSEALLFLYGALKVIERGYQTACELTVLMTDTHAYLNGYDDLAVDAYYRELRRLVNSANYNHIRMSRLMLESMPDLRTKGVIAHIDELIHGCNQNGLDASDPVKDSPGFPVLVENARRHCLRVRGSGSAVSSFKSPEAAARAYVALNFQEREVVERRFQNNIFVTYVSPEEDFVLPRLPKLRIFSIRKGMRSRPWFVAE